MSEGKVVDLSGKPVTLTGKTSPEIIRMIEEVLESAKAGHMSGVAIASIMGGPGERLGGTAFWCDAGVNSELLAVTVVMEHRQIKNIEEK